MDGHTITDFTVADGYGHGHLREGIPFAWGMEAFVCRIMDTDIRVLKLRPA
jgi:hypothetical protein